MRIVDYGKTGKVEKRKPAAIEDYFSDVDYKEQFQAMYYAYLTNISIPGRQITVGLMALKTMKEGIWMLNNNEPFSSDQFLQFETSLKKLITEILIQLYLLLRLRMRTDVCIVLIKKCVTEVNKKRAIFLSIALSLFQTNNFYSTTSLCVSKFMFSILTLTM